VQVPVDFKLRPLWKVLDDYGSSNANYSDYIAVGATVKTQAEAYLLRQTPGVKGT
jgi:hypothetical protein